MTRSRLALTGRLQTIDERPALVFERRLRHSVERVWRAISDPDELERWFLSRPGWTPRPGERWKAMGEPGEIVECEPPNLLAWRWGGEQFGFGCGAGASSWRAGRRLSRLARDGRDYAR